uniref:Uncharacterized protein n=1 Tax=Bicosoecida sp. CB-2014 TaxID=1486930 RepID=A0A7S1CKW2_9STRA
MAAQRVLAVVVLAALAVAVAAVGGTRGGGAAAEGGIAPEGNCATRIPYAACSSSCNATYPKDAGADQACLVGCDIRCEAIVFCWSLEQCQGRCDVAFPFSAEKAGCSAGCGFACKDT